MSLTRADRYHAQTMAAELRTHATCLVAMSLVIAPRLMRQAADLIDRLVDAATRQGQEQGGPK